MKQRHVKTIPERFGVDLNYKDKNSLRIYNNELIEKVKDYLKHINFENFDMEDCLTFCNIFHRGVFYLTALGAYDESEKYGRMIDDEWCGYIDCGDSYQFNTHDGFSKRTILKSKFKKGDKEYMEYQKYYVMKTSVDGWSLMWYKYPNYDGYYWVFAKNNVSLEGNIGTYIR